MIEEKIKNRIQEVLGVENVELEVPEREEHGDFSTNIAMQIFSSKEVIRKVQDDKSNEAIVLDLSDYKSPKQLADHIVGLLKDDQVLSNIVREIEVAGPGFINFWIKDNILIGELNNVLEKGSQYGRAGINKGKKVVVEYTDPNPFKEFHIGHLLSNVTGESLARLQEAIGAEVWRADYFGDVGVHVAKSIWGTKKKMEEDQVTLEDLSKMDLKNRINFFGQGYTLGSKLFKEDEEVKKQIESLNTVLYLASQRMWEEEGQEKSIEYDPENKISKQEIDEVYELYKQGRKWSLKYFETIYKRLGTDFDGYYPESKVAETGYKMVKNNIGKVFEESEGAVVFKAEKYGLHTRVFINKHNLPTYEAKELGLAPVKYDDFPYDESIIVVGKELKEYFPVLIKALELVNPKLGEVTTAICTGMIRLPGIEMSSRHGNVVTVLGLIDQLKEMAAVKMEDRDYPPDEKDEILEKVAIGALKYAFMKNSIGKDIEFDMEQSLSLEGNSGPYLQYTFARTQSVLRNARTENTEREKENKEQRTEDIGSGTSSRANSAKENEPSDLGNDRSESLRQMDWISRLEDSLEMTSINNEEYLLLRHFVHYPGVIIDAAKNYSPNILANYLYELAQKYNTFYNKHRILDPQNEDDEKQNEVIEQNISDFRVALTAATGQILKNGLNLLGIRVPEKM